MVSIFTNPILLEREGQRLARAQGCREGGIASKAEFASCLQWGPSKSYSIF